MTAVEAHGTLSADRRTLVIVVDDATTGGRRTVTLVRGPGNPSPFTDEDVAAAVNDLTRKPKPMMVGERRTTRRLRLPGGLVVYTHVNTGPPTWWAPRARLSVRRPELMVGWLRCLVAVAVRRERL